MPPSRRRSTALFVAAIAVLCVATGGHAAATPVEQCGTKLLYGHELTLQVRGAPLPCERVARIVRGTCRDRRMWTCFAVRPPDPALVWVRIRELFRRRWTTWIEAVRPPCSSVEAVTPEAWTEARAIPESTPTATQLLADDLLRCHQLDGMTRAEIVRLLGRPESVSAVGRTRHLWYSVGPERDSLFVIDGEGLVLVIGPDGRFRSGSFVQS